MKIFQLNNFVTKIVFAIRNYIREIFDKGNCWAIDFII